MLRTRTLVALAFVLTPLFAAANAAHAEKRIALVIGNAGYQAGALNTPANDAGLIAQTLQAAGFDVAGARDLDQDSLRHAFRDFVEKATGSGPDTVAFVYISGYGVQLEGENYFVPVDAKIAHDADIPSEALRISDYSRPLAASSSRRALLFWIPPAPTRLRNPTSPSRADLRWSSRSRASSLPSMPRPARSRRRARDLTGRMRRLWLR